MQKASEFVGFLKKTGKAVAVSVHKQEFAC